MDASRGVMSVTMDRFKMVPKSDSFSSVFIFVCLLVYSFVLFTLLVEKLPNIMKLLFCRCSRRNQIVECANSWVFLWFCS